MEQAFHCRLWTGALTKTGQPKGLPYRAAYIDLYGDIPKNYDVHHHYWNGPMCIHPYHLTAVSRKLHKKLHSSVNGIRKL